MDWFFLPAHFFPFLLAYVTVFMCAIDLATHAAVSCLCVVCVRRVLYSVLVRLIQCLVRFIQCLGAFDTVSSAFHTVSWCV